ncbi:DUF1963 domain-containing protein [Nonomuraea mesophila]|uniref:DUF1963 domain-containing protein n=1 Tax=Nonomuraea mesophila TaxID=2530382 RepID=A0A4R5EAB3_9ACTN|nr:YwqG family protein [Nonomuraea mesophila]TDE29132.1 DUF1963 domain-containing protein [Nonomuraea mesophila]
MADGTGGDAVPPPMPVTAPHIAWSEWCRWRDALVSSGEDQLGTRLARQLVRSDVLVSHDGARPRSLAGSLAGTLPGTSPGSSAGTLRGTRFGGRPLLDPACAWPTWEQLPLSFLARVDCAELAAAGHVDLLPRHGHLNFFYAAPWWYGDAGPLDDGWRVVHSGDGASEVEAPDGTPVFPEHAMRTTVNLPCPGGMFLDLPHTIQDRLAALEAAWERLGLESGLDHYPSPADGRPLHKVGGFPLPLQDLELDGFTREQRLLLQVDSDESLGWCWGDQGRLYFTLHETDLAAGDFTKVSVISDSH